MENYVEHPIQKHFLVRNLPNELRQQLIYGRKYIASIYEDMQKLAYLGLVQFAQTKAKEKDQQFIYVNTKAKLKGMLLCPDASMLWFLFGLLG